MAGNKATGNKDILVTWLNDAYAMEESLVPILENHAKDASHNPDMEQRIREHVEETRRHAELVKGCLERLGEEPSSAKSMIGKLFGNLQAPATGPFKDEPVKNGLTDYATENFEIASYSALIHAARQVGEQEIARICEGIRRDEERMAQWLEEHLPRVVDEAIQTT